ncbi:hypothetical protein AVEN_159495-1 [Araneus ventricosus]|uniref:Uncharacterized protein n=1 Tax=Araneus ventricosus TaxID=182803 RepID=A0A4Y2A2M0_ARAVE|nr:hypothetical protein AVEN_159495-1 [Araneus ventricosus]
MYRSFQNETNPLPKLWIRISDSESESVIPNPRIHHVITNPIRRIRSFWSESDPVVPFEDSDPRIRSGVSDSSLVYWHSVSPSLSLRFEDSTWERTSVGASKNYFNLKRKSFIIVFVFVALFPIINIKI